MIERLGKSLNLSLLKINIDFGFDWDDNELMPYLSKRFTITPEILTDLYWTKGLNCLETGRRLGLASRTVNIRLRECGIPIRKPGVLGPNITKEELEKLYIKRRMSSRKIAKIYNCAYSTVDRKIKQFDFPIKTLAAAHIFTHRADFSGNLKEKAYLIGFSIGDLRVRRVYKNSETIHADCGSTKPEQIALIKDLFKKYGKIWISKPSKTHKIQIECNLNNSFFFILKKYERFPNWALVKTDLFLSITGGFIDAEGSFFLSSRDGSSCFSLGNYNLTILKQIQKNLMSRVSIKSRLQKGYAKGYKDKQGYIRNGDYWSLRISKKSELHRFAKIILPYLKHQKRIKDAKKVIKNIEFRNKKYGYIGMEVLNFGHGQKIHIHNHHSTLC